jgi:hypothetical protein
MSGQTKTGMVREKGFGIYRSPVDAEPFLTRTS